MEAPVATGYFGQTCIIVPYPGLLFALKKDLNDLAPLPVRESPLAPFVSFEAAIERATPARRMHG
eukprot:763366-Hanusia_phi.AAC.2